MFGQCFPRFELCAGSLGAQYFLLRYGAFCSNWCRTRSKSSATSRRLLVLPLLMVGLRLEAGDLGPGSPQMHPVLESSFTFCFPPFHRPLMHVRT